MRTLAASAAIGVGLVLMLSPASAAVVCNDDGDCWRVKKHYDYKPEWKLHIHDDDWKWSDTDKDKYRSRESRGRGYWSKGVWIEF